MHVRETLIRYRSSADYLELLPQFCSKASYVDELVDIVCGHEPYPMSQYASHVLLHVARFRKDLLEKHVDQLIDLLFVTKIESVFRNVLGVLLCFPVESYKEGELLQLLFEKLEHPDTKPGIVSYSMKKIQQYLVLYPELKNEYDQVLALRQELMRG